jgi:tRNA wybutosine-synthesizing protein 3
MFDKRKKENLRKLKEALEKQEVDPPIIPLLEIINRHRDLVTTSSCSGRILLLYRRGKKIESEKYMSWHRKITLEELKEYLPENRENLWLRFEPFILHILARTEEIAFETAGIIRTAGVKRVGVQKARENYLIEAIGSDYISIPLFSCSCDDNIVEILNQHMERNLKRLKRLEKVLALFIEKQGPNSNDRTLE